MSLALLIVRVLLTLALLAVTLAIVNCDPNADHTSTEQKNSSQGQGTFFDGTGRPRRITKISMVAIIVLILMMIWTKF